MGCVQRGAQQCDYKNVHTTYKHENVIVYLEKVITPTFHKSYYLSLNVSCRA